MQTQPAPLPPPPVKRLEPTLPPMTDTILLNKQKVMNTVYTQLQTIVNQARWVENSFLHISISFCCRIWDITMNGFLTHHNGDFDLIDKLQNLEAR